MQKNNLIRLALLLVSLLSANWLFAEGKSVPYEVDSKKYEGYYISSKEDAPLVIIVHDWDGLNEYEIKRAKMLNEQGYAVFAVDMFGAGIRPTAIEDKKKLTGELYSDRTKMRTLLNAGLATAEKMGGNINNAVTIGYCFGGTCVLEWARSGVSLKGFVSFHGGLETPEGQNYKACKGKVLVFHGSADTYITIDQFAQIIKELEEQKISHEMITYSGAPHAFSVFGSDRYQEAADKKSWARFLLFLKEI